MRDRELVLEVLHQIEEAAPKLFPDFRLSARWPTLPIIRPG